MSIIPPVEDSNYFGSPIKYKDFWTKYKYKKFIIESFSSQPEALQFENELIKDFWDTFGREYSLNGAYILKGSNFMYSLSNNKESRKKSKLKRSKSCFFIDPKGKMVDVPNLAIFCEENGFDTTFKNGLIALSNGRYRSYRGWTACFYDYLELKFFKTKAKVKKVVLKNDNGTIETVFNRQAFADKYNLCASHISALCTGKIEKAYDWNLVNT
jgi:hypothetical protein